MAADELSELKYQYDPANIRIVNTGATWRMDFSADGSNLSGGPLVGDYKVGKMDSLSPGKVVFSMTSTWEATKKG